MKKASFTGLFLLLVFMNVSGQKTLIHLSFTAHDNTAWVPLDSIRVINKTKKCDTVFIYPDTVLIINDPLAGQEILKAPADFQVRQTLPDPETGLSRVKVFLPEGGTISFTFTDLSGRTMRMRKMDMDPGYHSFHVQSEGHGVFLLTAEWKGQRRTLLILNPSSPPGQQCILEYDGGGDAAPGSPAAQLSPGFDRCCRPGVKSLTAPSFPYSVGDQFLFIGYANGNVSGIADIPAGNTDWYYSFNYATGIPCPGMSEVIYEGQSYSTVQILGQCWMKENLNIGTRIPGNINMSNDGVIEKWCYDDLEENCVAYGGLFDWYEIMQYTVNPRTRGICPEGWHIPTDEDWKVLEGAADTQYGIGDLVWDQYSRRGFDQALNLKSGTGWVTGGNGTDLVGFNGLPAGIKLPDGAFYSSMGENAHWWCSREMSSATSLRRELNHSYDQDFRDNFWKNTGMSIRCLRDN